MPNRHSSVHWWIRRTAGREQEKYAANSPASRRQSVDAVRHGDIKSRFAESNDFPGRTIFPPVPPPPCSRSPMAHLEIIDGPDAGRTHKLSDSAVVMGRHPDCDLVLDVGAVSRQHAKLECEGNRYFLVDLKSRNGTLLNELPVSGRLPLKDGDQLQICDVTLLFATSEPRELPSAARTIRRTERCWLTMIRPARRSWAPSMFRPQAEPCRSPPAPTPSCGRSSKSIDTWATPGAG